MARESNPLGLSAVDAKRAYPHDGADADNAQVELYLAESEDQDVSWYPSRSTVLAPGHTGPLSRPEAVGLVDFTAKRGAKERAAVFQGALLPDPCHVERKGKGSLDPNTYRQMTWKAY